MADTTGEKVKPQSTEKRDHLIASEKKYQAQWRQSKLFEQDAPSLEEVPFHSITPAELREKYPKYMATMAYPYVNGAPHLGHAFTVSKLEFATGWARMRGQKALYPQGYHCTGMPIRACADKLAREIEMFGKNFEGYSEAEEDIDATPAPVQETTKTDVTKFTTSKSKAKAKFGSAKYQFQIMQSLGEPLDEIHRFADPQHWIKHFPPIWKRDLDAIGARVDWRRSMVTTDANLYYDAFVRWQMNRLKELGKIKFGKRYSIYSPKDGQACMDHDRSKGEGVGCQAYTALKLEVKEWAAQASDKISGKLPADAKVYFVPATLRPETMYGQTCCFVGPKVEYGIFKVTEKEYFFISQRAARNMAFQNIFPTWGVFPQVATLVGSEVVGTLVDAPLSVHTGGIRILPMESVKPSKGTGVVTCVPSDSPDDYATVLDLTKKADYYGIKREWVDLPILPVIETPSYGNLTAKFLVESMKINSPKDAAQLAEAKDLAYKEGFYKGVMVYGDFKGKSVEQAKQLVQQQLIDSGDAFVYNEPDGQVVSRSSDECVAALTDQWYFNYGEANDQQWYQTVMDYVSSDGVNTYSPDVKKAFQGYLDWLKEWPCARTYGLGTRLPWDDQFLVESLSDSTIYMSYYTIAHLLHKDVFGHERGPADVSVEQMTDEVWDYIFCRREDVQSDIPKETLQRMRREFEYWYPMDIRISGKDLIGNHLTFCLYIHTAIFPREYWPKAIRANGHLLLNGDKMSKSTGNFMTLHDSVQKYGADATRLALADAGDTMDDANLSEDVANAAIIDLYTWREWCEELTAATTVASPEEATQLFAKSKNNVAVLRKGDMIFWDRMFENELYELMAATRAAYEGALYRLALKSGFYDMKIARDRYRKLTTAAGVGMHADLISRYFEYQALAMTVITPHWSEQIWLEVLKKEGSVQNARFPEVPEANAELSQARDYVVSTTSNITSAEGAQLKRMAKGKATTYVPTEDKKLTVYCALEYPDWQDKYIEIVRQSFESKLGLDMKDISKQIEKADSKKAMPFIQGMKRNLESGVDPKTVFERKMPFDELVVLEAMAPGLGSAVLKCVAVEIVRVDQTGQGEVVHSVGEHSGKVGDKMELPASVGMPTPGAPTFFFGNV